MIAFRRIAFAVAAIAIVAFAVWLRCAPIPNDLLDERRFVSTAIVDRNGVLLSEPLSTRGDRSEWLRADQLPQHVVAATLAAEDRRFYSHLGIDPIAVARAVVHDVRRGRLAEGGSTITQQVAKLLLQHRQRGLRNKLEEAVLALRLEHRLTKPQILALYLNLAPYGNSLSGVTRASHRYFGHAPADLTFAESAFLASLPQRPSAFNPLRDPKRALTRQRTVLTLMHLPKQEYAEARAERLHFEHGTQPLIAPHFVERVLEQNGAAHVARIETTLDSRLQRQVEGIIAAERPNLLRHGAHSVAVAVLDNATGEWLAWEGSGNYFGADADGGSPHEAFGGAIDGVVALRQPGSTLKPFTYAVAFEQGASPATVLPDIPSHFATAQDGIVYTPRNYDGQFRGPLRAREALAGSENVPAVAMLQRVGPPTLLRFLRRVGFVDLQNTADYYGLGLTLGDAEVRLDQLVAAYSMFARGGVAIEPRMIRSAKPAVARRVVSPRTAFWITDILSDSGAREFIFGRGGNLDFPFTVAVKTGTSQAYHDNWTIGYTRDVTVGVWVGNFDRVELRNSTGVTGAGPIFHQVMLAAVQRTKGSLPIGDDAPIVEPPSDLEHVQICALSGLRPSTSCPNVENEWVSTSQRPEFCAWHHRGEVDWPAEYRPWARTAGLLHGEPSAVLVASRARQRNSLHIVSPPDSATYLLDATLHKPYQSVHLRAIGNGSVTWKVNDEKLATTTADASLDWPLRRGTHTITATDSEGHRDSVSILVK